MIARVAVIGAGIGGLVAALALADAGFEVSVHEQAEALGEVGAGLTVSRGAQAVLAELGLTEALRNRASVVRSNAFLHYRTGVLIDGDFDHSDGAPEPATATPAGTDRPAPLRNWQIHRADLHGILAAALRARVPDALHLSERLVGLDDDGPVVRLSFDGGRHADADVVVGADGLRSRVRALLWGERAPRPTGQVAYRCMVDGSRAAPFLGAGRAAVYFGPDRVFNRYSLRRGSIVNCVAIARTGSWRDEGYDNPAEPAEVAELYAGWHPDVTGLLARSRPGELRRWALYDRDPLPRWRQGNVTLLGDAAHPMLPFLGLGAAMAIEDGFVLARSLSAASSVGAGLDDYEARRGPRTRRVMLAARLEGELVQSRSPERFDAAAAPSRNAEFYDFDPSMLTFQEDPDAGVAQPSVHRRSVGGPVGA
jgi:salicylate hydroxylase